MSLTNWFKGNTPLQLAIQRGLKPGGNLIAELDELDGYTIKSKGDAKAICEALESLEEGRVSQQKPDKSPLYALAGLFQDTEGGSAACEFLRENGTPLLSRLTRKALADDQFDQSELLFVLKMLAAYGTTEGADLVIETAKRGYANDKYHWSLVMGTLTAEHPEARRVFAALGDPLPDKFLAVSLLDASNRLFLDGGEMRHPFDSDQGAEKLTAWLRDGDPESFSYATSAATALPFIDHHRQGELFHIAFGHPDAGVQLEAARAATKLENPVGLQKIAEFCKDVNYSSRAKSYLKDLGREDVIPPESTRPDFMALAEFAQWLAHPNELGRFPDELEVLDHRDLRWPTDGEMKHLWLIKYRMKDTTGLTNGDTGVGLVGSVTFCLFSYELDQSPPEDAYAVHCYWEMTHKKRIIDNDVEGTSEYDSLFEQWNGSQLEDKELVAICELSPDVKYPRRLVGLACAKLNGLAGWAVLDGPESRWYSADEMPEGTSPKRVLKVHIGRRLLGFKCEPDRKQFRSKNNRPPPEQIKQACEKLLVEAEHGTPAQRKRLIGGHGLLGQHFEALVDAAHSIDGGSKALHFAETYEKIIRIARLYPDEADNLLDIFAAAGDQFEQYISALLELRRQSEIVPLIELVAGHWQHNLGYRRLGSAAFAANRDELAEKFFLRLKKEDENWQGWKEMSHLAEIWQRQGRNDEARFLLVECMRKMLEDGRKADGSDRNLFEEWFQSHREVFLRLFPTEPLLNHGLPETTLR